MSAWMPPLDIGEVRVPDSDYERVAGPFVAKGESEFNYDVWADSGRGSYYFPPVAMSRDRAVHFWGHVEVPEEVLHRVEQGYYERSVQVLNDYVAEYEQTFPNPRNKRRGCSDEEYEAWRTRVLRGFRQRWYRPLRLRPDMVRPIVRVSRVHFESGFLHPNDLGRMDEIPLRMPNLDRVTPSQVVEYYGMEDFRDVICTRIGTGEEQRLTAMHEDLQTLLATTEDVRNMLLGAAEQLANLR